MNIHNLHNPYTNRGAIKNPKEFYGREKEVRRIYSRISSSHPQCISIIGERKIGKSSLLYYISHEDILKQSLKESASYLFLLFDLQERINGLSFLSFFQFIFKELSERLGSSVVPNSLIENVETETECYEAFKRVVSSIGRQNLKLILLFDEFGTITRNEQFDPSFFSFLRSIANNHECAYITTSKERLQKLCHNTDVSESPFFNIFTPVPLGQFDVNESKALILEPSAQAGVRFDESEAEFVSSVAGRHPMFIQMACAALFDYKTHDGSASKSKKVDFDKVKADFLVEANDQFEHIWQDADEVERRVLDQVVLGEKVASHQLHLIKDLQRKGYLTEAESPEIFSRAFAEFIIGKHPGAKVEKEKVEKIDKVSQVSVQTPSQPEKEKGASFLSRLGGLLKRKE